jgi:hypothetical protein
MEVDEENNLNNDSNTSQTSNQRNDDESIKAPNEDSKSSSFASFNVFAQPTELPPFYNRRCNSGIFSSIPFGSRYKYLQKLHSDSICLGLNAVSSTSLSAGAIFKSSPLATPVSTPTHKEPCQYTNEALIHKRLFRSQHQPNFQNSPHHTLSHNGGSTSRTTTSDNNQPMDTSSSNIEKESLNVQNDDCLQSTDSTSSSIGKKIFVANIGFRVGDNKI